MGNTILIKEVNNQPVIFNVDNATDGAVLEELGAIKMPEAMASEVFGEDLKYADNTTCVITKNQDNPAFPYNVNFDASKIIKKPGRNLSNLRNFIIDSNKPALRGTRTTDGLLTLTDLTPYKPVIVLCKLNTTSGICGTYITTVSDGGTGDTEGHSYGIGSITGKFVSTNCYVVIPVSATVVLSFYMMGNAKIEAYQ